MAPNPRIMAAPNQSQIQAKVLQIRQSPQFADKWLLELEILAVTSISSGSFIQVGQQVSAFTVGAQPHFSIGSKITATAEYMGNPQGGMLQLSRISVLSD